MQTVWPCCSSARKSVLNRHQFQNSVWIIQNIWSKCKSERIWRFRGNHLSTSYKGRLSSIFKIRLQNPTLWGKNSRYFRLRIVVNSIFQWSIVSGRLFGGSKPSIWVLPNLRKYHSMRYEEKFVYPCAVFDQSDFESFTQSELEAPWSIFWRIALDNILELCLSLAGFHRFFISLDT